MHALRLVLLLLLALAAARAADQPQWGERHTRNMVSVERGLPDDFDPATGRNVRWSVEVGTQTHSTPVVAGGRILIGTNNERPRDPRHQGDRGVLMCFDERDGRFLWQLVVPKYSSDPFQDWPKAGLCSTATVEGDRVYVLSNRGEALCLDLQGLANGNDGPVTNENVLLAPRGAEPLPLQPQEADVLWWFDIHARVDSWPHDSAHSSFLLEGDHLYINTGNGVDNTHRKIRRPDAPSLIVLDKRTGAWVAQDGERIGPRIFHSTWSSPALGTWQGKPCIVFAGGDGLLYGFEPVGPAPVPDTATPPRTLKKLWWFDGDPSSPKENVHQFNSNRQVSPSNIKGMPVFHRGRVYVALGGDLWWGKHEAWLQCVDLAGAGDLSATGRRWAHPLERHSMSTPSLHEGLVFIADCGRTVHCLEAESGRALWSHDTGGEIWASTLVADGKVYVGNRRGRLTVFAAAREKRVVAEVELGSPISGTVTPANGVLYAVTMERLYALALAGPSR